MQTINETWEQFTAMSLPEWTPEQLDIARAIFCAGATVGQGLATLKSIEVLLAKNLESSGESLSIVDTANTIRSCSDLVTAEIDALNGSEPEHEPPRIITLN